MSVHYHRLDTIWYAEPEFLSAFENRLRASLSLTLSGEIFYGISLAGTQVSMKLNGDSDNALPGVIGGKSEGDCNWWSS